VTAPEKFRTPPHLKRARPAFLSYASDWIADEAYINASARERGLFFSMLNYAWVNGSVPFDRAILAKVLGISETDADVSCPLIMKHFHQSPTSGRLLCPELDRQRKEDEEIRRRKAEGGQRGGFRTQARNRAEGKESSSSAKAAEMSGDEMSGDEKNRKEPTTETDDLSEHREWVEDYSRPD
jgi:hypothetical protein